VIDVARTRDEKAAQVAEVAELLERNGVYLTDFRGLNVMGMVELRRELRQANVTYRVVKNTLAKRAAEEAGLGVLAPYLEGATALAVSDEVMAPARVLRRFAQQRGLPRIKCGWVDGRLFGEETVGRLASLPDRDVLVAQLLGGLKGPVTGLAGVFRGLLQQLVGTLAALETQKREDAA
jgi:large subunit ribosomal protein L10